MKKKKILKAIDKCNFHKLQNIENKNGFVEAVSDKNGKDIKFFNLGPNNDWRNILDPKIALKIEKLFKNEMIELGYIK